MNKFFSFLVNVCFVFSIIFIAAGCAKKAPPPSIASEDKAAVDQPLVSEDFLDVTRPAEETFEGLSAPSGPSKEAGEEFLGVPGGSIPRDFKATSELSTVHFDFDQYDINPDDQIILGRNAAWLAENPNTFVQIEGHCDSRGTLDYNLALGDRRANSIKNYLISLNVNSSRISTITYGEEIPLCAERNEPCWSQNRRGEFLIAE